MRDGISCPFTTIEIAHDTSQGHHATRFSGVPRPVKPLRFAPTPSGLAGLTAPAVRLA
jgi:hypothetical protein